MKRTVLITGGAGFIGSNLAGRLAGSGKTVTVFDDFSSPGARKNLQWLMGLYRGRVRPVYARMSDRGRLGEAVSDAELVFHLANKPVDGPDAGREYELNGAATINLLKALSSVPDPPPAIFVSTSRVYGGMDDIELRPRGHAYEPVEAELREYGIGETMPLEPDGRYGCFKPCMEMNILKYARESGLPLTVLRLGCIYGPRQTGAEEQGWVAQIFRKAISGERIAVNGDGRQVRDILFVDDLVEAFTLAAKNIARLAGGVYNIGGGPANAISLWQVLLKLEELQGWLPPLVYRDWRKVGQRYFVSDIRRFSEATGFRPVVSNSDGLDMLYYWMCDRAGVRPARAGQPGRRAIMGA
jgi:CDP-paratose 2-epimerase